MKVHFLTARLLSWLFPKHYYLQRCITIYGIREPHVDCKFRRQLMKALLPQENDKIPTLCCCFALAKNRYTATVNLYRGGQTALVAESANSRQELFAKVISSARSICANESSWSSQQALPSQCQKCSIPKAHLYCERFLPQINTLNKANHRFLKYSSKALRKKLMANR